jgi:4-aminobutyrate aminotransferase-like enzyme
MTMVNGFSADDAEALPDDERAMIARRERVLGPAYRLFYERPVHLVRGRGAWLYGPDGEAYLDAYNNVASVGHCHPHVVAALSRQSAILNTHTRYLTEGVLDYAERMTGLFPDALSQIMFTCTGSEANDLALRIARAHTGGMGLIVTRTAYHGVTVAIAEASPSLGAYVPLGETVRTVAPPDARLGADVGETFAAGVRAAIADLRAAGIQPAALLVDTVFSSDGVFVDPAGFLGPAAGAIREAGGVFIADEVQAGFGRTGAGMWGFARHGLIPDIVTMGKPMGNGHPLAAVVIKPEVLEAFGRKSRYFNTFGGNPVSCAVGMAVLDVIEDEGLIANSATVGAYLMEGLRGLPTSGRYRIGDLRGTGLFIGADIVDAAGAPSPEGARRLVNGLREKRVLISATGPNADLLKIRPPLVFSRDNADTLLAASAEVLAGL